MYVRTHIPIHNVLAEVVVIFEIQCLLNFHYDVGYHAPDIIKFHLPQCFSLSVIYMHIYTYSIKNVLAETVV